MIRYSGKALMSLCGLLLATGAVVNALKWPFKAAAFPVIIGVPVFFMSAIELLLTLSGKKEITSAHAPVDFKLTEDIDQALAFRRTLIAFLWIIGFFLMVVFFGFSIAIPLFVLLYLKLQGKEKWGISLILTASTWVFFYGLFVRLLDTPLSQGWVFKGLRMLPIFHSGP